MPIRLSKKAVKAIHTSVDRLFDKLKTRLLGPSVMDKRIYIGFHHEFSIPGLYEAAAKEEGIIPSEQVLGSVMNVAENYVEGYRSLAKARVVREVQSFLNVVEAQNAAGAQIDTDLETVLDGRLSEIWKDVTTSVHQIVDAEAQNAKNVSVMDAIVRINAEQSVSDPVVCFIVVRDEHLCDECKRLHMMGDGHTPRLWFLSEVGHGYHKRGQENPKIGGLHPHCRCTMATVMPGYGFNAGGYIEYKSPGYSAIAVQRGLRLSEPEFPYEPHDCTEHCHHEPQVGVQPLKKGD